MLLMLLSHGHNGVRKIKRQGSDAADAPVPWACWCVTAETHGEAAGL